MPPTYPPVVGGSFGVLRRSTHPPPTRLRQPQDDRYVRSGSAGEACPSGSITCHPTCHQNLCERSSTLVAGNVAYEISHSRPPQRGNPVGVHPPGGSQSWPAKSRSRRVRYRSRRRRYRSRPARYRSRFERSRSRRVRSAALPARSTSRRRRSRSRPGRSRSRPKRSLSPSGRSLSPVLRLLSPLRSNGSQFGR